MSRNVAKKDKVTVPAVATDDDLLAMADSVDHGFRREDLMMPFIKVLQKLSPELDETEVKFMEGAKPGDFCHTALEEYYSGADGILMVPVAYTINYTAWRPRDESGGGGLVQDYGSDPSCLEGCTRNEKKQLVDENGNLIVTSGLYYAYIVVNDQNTVTGKRIEQAIIQMASTQLKKSRRLNAKIEHYRHVVETKDGPVQVKVPMYFHVFKLTTVPEQNDQGKWMGYKIDPVGNVRDYEWGSLVWDKAKELKSLYDEGVLTTNIEQAASDSEAAPVATEQSQSSGQNASDDNIPF